MSTGSQNRLGLIDTKTVKQTETELNRIVNRRLWTRVNNTFVMYGQNVCLPVRPMCGICDLKGMCKYYYITATNILIRRFSLLEYQNTYYESSYTNPTAAGTKYSGDSSSFRKMLEKQYPQRMHWQVSSFHHFRRPQLMKLQSH